MFQWLAKSLRDTQRHIDLIWKGHLSEYGLFACQDVLDATMDNLR